TSRGKIRAQRPLLARPVVPVCEDRRREDRADEHKRTGGEVARVLLREFGHGPEDPEGDGQGDASTGGSAFPVMLPVSPAQPFAAGAVRLSGGRGTPADPDIALFGHLSSEPPPAASRYLDGEQDHDRLRPGTGPGGRCDDRAGRGRPGI